MAYTVNTGYTHTLCQEPFWILMKQEMMGWQWHQLDHMQIIFILLQTDNNARTRYFTTQFLTGQMLFVLYY